MSDHSFDVTTADFDEKVLAASHQLPVLVDFWAEWCAPCRVLKPLLEKLAAEFAGRFLLAKVDSDHNPELSQRYGVRGIPNVKAFYQGKQVDEFTGALPEVQVRAFLERIMPSPVDPLRDAAQEARRNGEFEVAISLINDGLALDPGHEGAQLDLAELHIDGQSYDAARAVLEALEHRARDTARLAALKARLNLASAGGGADVASLSTELEADPANLVTRFRLAQALALAHEYRGALTHLLDLVRRDKNWSEQAARKTMLDLFTLLGSDSTQDDLVREFRIALARTLN